MKGENTIKNRPKGFRTHTASKMMNPRYMRSLNGLELEAMVNRGDSTALKEYSRRDKKRKRKGDRQ